MIAYACLSADRVMVFGANMRINLLAWSGWTLARFILRPEC